ncbi:MAG TPA: hypothetical protein VHO71_05570 [Caproiciproducens sp.]|nr:hypothetical protein [Caproiciproducens sp.]
MRSSLNIIGMIGTAACLVWLLFIIVRKRRPQKSLLAGVLIAFAVFVTAAVLPAGNTIPEQNAASSAGTATGSFPVNIGKSSKGRLFQTEFVGGYYTPGIDFPAGNYHLSVIAGSSGTVYVTNPSGAGKLYTLGTNGQRELNNISLPLGEAFSVAGLKIKIESTNADGQTLSERENPATKKVALSPGIYTVGLNFDEGIYDIAVLKGKGTVQSDSEGAPLHETFDANGNDYNKEFKNLTLDSGTKLTIRGVTVDLVPSK